MGCDIHMYVEYKRQEKWVNGDYFKENQYYDSNDESEPKYAIIELYGSRNYSLFSTLAGVRDYSEKVEPVSEPKGFPEDSCEFVRKEYEDWDCDGHTHSWLTLKELKEFQSTNPVMHYSGMISQEQIKSLEENGKKPDSWCQWTTMKGFERREWTEPNETLIPLIERLQNRCHELLQYEWQEYNDENDNNIRIVFWFDN